MTNGVLKRLIRGVTANSYGYFITMGMQLVNIPVYLYFWGGDFYGEWLVLTAIPAYLLLTEAGLISAAANKMVMLYKDGDGDVEKTRVVFHSAWGMVGIISFFILFVILLLLAVHFYCFEWGFESISSVDGYLAFLCMCLYMILGLNVAVINAGYRCVGMYSEGVFLANHIRVFEWLVTIGVLFFGGGALLVGFAFLASRMVGLIFMYMSYLKVVPDLKLGVGGFSKKEVGELLGPALSFMGFPLGNAINNQGIVLILGIMLSPSSVVVFSAYRTLTRMLVQIVTVVNQSAWPEMTKAYGIGDFSLLRLLYIKVWRVAVFFSVLGVLGMMSLGEYLLDFWLGKEVGYNQWLFLLLVFSVGVNNVWQSGQVVLMAVSKHKELSRFYVLMSVLYLLISMLGIFIFGVEGAGGALFVYEMILCFWVFIKINDFLGVGLSCYLGFEKGN